MTYNDNEIITITMTLEHYEELQNKFKENEYFKNEFQNIDKEILLYNENGKLKKFFDTYDNGFIEVNIKEILKIMGYETYIKNMEIKII